jgi:cobalt/nickel transport system permease protein
VGGGHTHAVVEGPSDSFVARLDPSVKIACLVAFLFAVVATPAPQVWAFAVFLALVLGVAALARMPVRVLVRRLAIEVPFVAFAIAMPFVGHGPHVTVFGVSLSEPGLWAAWSILAKATLGVLATSLLAWSTPVADVLAGLEALHVPSALVAIASFMVRYLDVVGSELRRLQIARVSRGDDPRWLWQGRAVASTAGTMFVRSFERGERVHQAMLARGFDGHMPHTAAVRTRRWWPALAWPLVGWAVAATAMIMAR